MSRGVNKVILVGHLGKDPETKYMPSGGAVTQTLMGAPHPYGGAQGTTLLGAGGTALGAPGRTARAALQTAMAAGTGGAGAVVGANAAAAITTKRQLF